MIVVDSHTHIWSSNLRAYPWSPHDGVSLPTETASAENLLAEFDHAGVLGGICIQPRSYGYDHAYLNSALETYPDRLAGVCIVNPVRPNGPDELKRLVAGYGYRGLRLNPMADSNPLWLDGPEGEPLWHAAADLNLVVSVLIDPEQLPQLFHAAERFPQVSIVIDHLGRCTSQSSRNQIGNLTRLAKLPNTYIKISALSTLSKEPYPYNDLHPLIEDCYQSYGPHRLLWGTDFPHILANGPYPLALNAVRESMPFIDSDDFPAMLGENTMRLYRLNSWLDPA